MPKVYRRRIPRRPKPGATLTHDMRAHLLYGRPMFSDAVPMDLAAFAEAWKQFGRKLTSEWIAEHPGTRPFAWWVLEHKKERPVIAESDLEDELRADPFSFGFLHTHLVGWWPTLTEFQEPEENYLRRHRLLTAAELSGHRRRIRKDG